MEKLKEFWTSLDEDTQVNRKLFLFEIITAVLAGFVIGFLVSPFRSITIASNNENNGNGNSASGDEEDEDE